MGRNARIYEFPQFSSSTQIQFQIHFRPDRQDENFDGFDFGAFSQLCIGSESIFIQGIGG